MSKGKKVGKVVGYLILLLLLSGGVYVYQEFFKSNTGSFENSASIYLKKDATYDTLISQLKQENILADLASFDGLSKQMSLRDNIHPGKYTFTTGMSNYSMVKKLRSGEQEIIKIVVNKLRTKSQIAEHLAAKIEIEPTDFQSLFNDNNYLEQFGLDSNNIQCIVMPYTYDVYWNVSALEVLEKLATAFKRYWTTERKEKAKKMGLTVPEVITIASIVDEETNKNDEKGNVASVYLNRIKKGMKLQADPTARFAYGDFSIRRVLNKHLQYASPWNTYYTAGLPPGPICTPQPSSIEAVLNAPNTEYIFFCAKEDFSGYHNFATNGTEHEANAKKFRDAMNERGIRK